MCKVCLTSRNLYLFFLKPITRPQIEINYRRHFKVQFKRKISAIEGRKHCEKRRNCLLQAISPFLTMFSTAIYL